MDSQGNPYQFQPYEPGVFVEVYLPKKALYQGTLYNALTEAFDFERVKEHFRDPDKRDHIYKLLERYTETKDIETRLDRLNQFYWGYSMYEVDGVFFEKGVINEERTQVIRIIFLPDLQEIQSLAPSVEYGSLRRFVKRALKADSDERQLLRNTHPEIIDYINNWIGDVGLFLFGYVIFHLCSRIKELNEAARGDLEKEIWVSSFWALEINRVILSKN